MSCMYQGVLLTEAGIEPALFPLKGNVLPLDYSKKRFAENAFRIKPRTLAAKHPFPLTLEM